MKTNHRTIHREDYTEPDYYTPEIRMSFELNPESTLIRSVLSVERNKSKQHSPLVLSGECMKLIEVSIDGKKLKNGEYTVNDRELVLSIDADKAEVTTLVEINPSENTALEGLYMSGSMFCTQNEPEGFRRITYSIDRPDNMTRYTVELIADKKNYPVLLSNGNRISETELPGGKHSVIYVDPFPKPSYLFAVVAGDLDRISDSFNTRSGREIELNIYSDRGNADRCFHAMESLKKAMKWDEERFGLEYDLDTYSIVAADSFNMGAMENKGLNIFNSSYVLAAPETATDSDYLGIESVIAHEYFHNWTGNRVTCRDWFQLTLKEGLTVFRDQEFSADVQSPTVNRIMDVDSLRADQFEEDAGPNSHPVRPDNYIEINNFYTRTVYEKGAEVIRMIHTILGEERFMGGMKLYFERHDGRAVTCDDFVDAMQDASGIDLSVFRRWYGRAGTPVLCVDGSYDTEKKAYTLKLRQQNSDRRYPPDAEPLHIPIKIGLLYDNGEADLPNEGLIHLMENEQTFIFNNIKQRPALSVNRGFTAPVKVKSGHSDDELRFLFANDSDSFCRWDAGQSAALKSLRSAVEAFNRGSGAVYPDSLLQAYGSVIEDKNIDNSFKALALLLPSEQLICQEMNPVDFEAVHAARRSLKSAVAHNFRDSLLKLYQELEDDSAYSPDMESIGRRSLRLRCLEYISELNSGESIELCKNHFLNAGNMTDSIGSLRVLAGIDSPVSLECLSIFREKWQDNMLVMNKWFAVQAASSLPGTLDKVKQLEMDSAYNVKVPNIVRSLLVTFSRNQLRFNSQRGDGYRYIAEKIKEIDPINPSMSSMLAGSFKMYGRLDEARRLEMRKALEDVLAGPGLSKNAYEIVSKTLGMNK